MTCLLTTLKDAVTDTQIPHIDEIVLKITNANEESSFSISGNGNPVLVYGEGVSLKNGESGNPNTYFVTSSPSPIKIYIHGQNGKVRIRNINNLQHFDINGIGIEPELPEQFIRAINLRYCMNSTSDPSNTISGKLKWFLHHNIVCLSMSGYLEGNLSEFSCPECESISLGVTNTLQRLKPISGEISVKNFPVLSQAMFKSCRGPISIQLSSMPQLIFVSGTNSGVVGIWAENAPASYPIVALENVDMGNGVSAMLIDQAKRNLSTAATSPWMKTIAVFGVYDGTSAASAIATLKSKGVIVIINGVTY